MALLMTQSQPILLLGTSFPYTSRMESLRVLFIAGRDSLRLKGKEGLNICQKLQRKSPAESSYSLFKLTGITGYVSVMTKEFPPLHKTKACKYLLKNLSQTPSCSVSRVTFTLLQRTSRSRVLELKTCKDFSFLELRAHTDLSLLGNCWG